MFNFKKTKDGQAKERCVCTTTQGLFMQNRQVSLIVASLLLLSFFLFMGGYFLGQKNAVTAFSNKIDQESFGDQIYSSMCSLCDNGAVEDDEQDEENDEDNNGSNAQPDKQVTQELPTVTQDDSVAPQAEASVTSGAPESTTELQGADSDDQDAQSAEYFAQLAGFGTARAAHQFAQKLARKEISVIVKERQSRSARGKFVSWYQVVTEKFEDKNELTKLVARLQSEEKLKDVNIITC